MLFNDISFTGNPSVMASLNITEKDLKKFIKKLSIKFVVMGSKVKVLKTLDDMPEQDFKCFCFLALIGYQYSVDTDKLINITN
jgi:hypothetical protein